MKPPQWLGAGILACVALLALLLSLIPDSRPEPIVIHGKIGNLKLPLFEHPEFKRIMLEHGWVMDVEPGATRDLVCPDDPAFLDGMDFVIVGEMSQIGEYERCNPGRSDRYKPIFLSPMVIYSWQDSIDALVEAGVASQDDKGAYHIDLLKLVELLESGKTWKDLGFPDRPSRVRVHATDPDGSSSGGTFAGLLANGMNCLDVVDSGSVGPILPRIFDYYEGLGYLEPSSEALFRSYLTQGEGARPMAALLESQLADYLYAHPEDRDKIADQVRMLYPSPTVWTSHPFIARTELGEELMEVMLSPEVQELAWEVTGFRPAVPGLDVDVSQSGVPGMLTEIDSVIDLPGEEVLAQIIDATKNKPPDSTEPPRDCSEAA